MEATKREARRECRGGSKGTAAEEDERSAQRFRSSDRDTKSCPKRKSPTRRRGLELRGIKHLHVSYCVSVVRPFYGGLGAARWRAEQSEKKKPRTEAGLEVWRVARINDNSKRVRSVRLFYGVPASRP
jgi:hypothetical protein